MIPAFLPAAPVAVSSPPKSSFILRTAPRHAPVFAARRSVAPSAAPRMSAAGAGASAAAADASTPLVPILMGSASDMPYCEKIAAALSALGIQSDLRVASAHKVPARLMQVIAAYEACPRPIVYVAVAGRSNALSGMLDCAVSAPVISCPPPSDAFGGADIFSSIRMPSGVAPAFVLEPGTAALLAAKILGVYDDGMRANVMSLQKANRDRLYVDDAESVTKSYGPMIAAAREGGISTTETDAEGVFGPGGSAIVLGRSVGKVREAYSFKGKSGEDLLALVTTDRQSAFDRVLAAIPFKGAVLNLTAAWWFENTKHIVDNHVVSVPHPYVTVAKKCSPFPVEFVVRGYITGSTATSLWKNYSGGVRTYCGIEFKDGLVKNQKLEENVLTPTTKAEIGDEPIAPVDVVKRGLMTQEDWDVCAKASMELFAFGQKVAAERGLILVDTKYEFGRDADGRICLIDEVHTPDSSRYWLATSYDKRMREGKEPQNVDKEFLRLWFRDNCDPYDTEKALPAAPDELVDELSRRYIMLYELITGKAFDFAGVSAEMAECMSALSVKEGAVPGR